METETPGGKTAPRAWLLAVLGVVLVGAIAYQMWPERPSATPATASSNRGRNARQSDPREALDPDELKVRLDDLAAKRPEPGEVERNPFRFKPPPAPPPPPPAPKSEGELPPVAPTPQQPTVAPIPLRFMGTVERGNLKLAALTDCKGFTFAAREGESGIDGRYRLVRIGQESVVMEYMNGTGRVTIRKSGECPR
jgi:hypothetical protein